LQTIQASNQKNNPKQAHCTLRPHIFFDSQINQKRSQTQTTRGGVYLLQQKSSAKRGTFRESHPIEDIKYAEYEANRFETAQ